jgi:hypothetical protein
MLNLSDKVKAWGLSIVGAGGVLAGLALITKNPKNIYGYCYTIASITSLKYGIKDLNKVYDK